MLRSFVSLRSKPFLDLSHAGAQAQVPHCLRLANSRRRYALTRSKRQDVRPSSAERESDRLATKGAKSTA